MTMNPATGSEGTQPTAPGQGNEGRGFTSDGNDFWSQQKGYLDTVQRRLGIQANQPQSQSVSADPDFEEFKKWKAAKEKKDPRGILEMAGMTPGEVLNASLFGGPAPAEEPKPDPVTQISAQLQELRSAFDADRTQRQTAEESQRELQAKDAFIGQLKSQVDLKALNNWGQEAYDVAWGQFVTETDIALKQRAEGNNAPLPSLRQVAIQVENYLRAQAKRLQGVFGNGTEATLEPLNIDVPSQAPSQGAMGSAQQTNTPNAPSPTLTNNVGAQTGTRPEGRSPEELRARALEAAKRLRGK